jgi:hypothetical protein
VLSKTFLEKGLCRGSAVSLEFLSDLHLRFGKTLEPCLEGGELCMRHSLFCSCGAGSFRGTRRGALFECSLESFNPFIQSGESFCELILFSVWWSRTGAQALELRGYVTS